MIGFATDKILHSMNVGYALHEFITDENGQPCDYVFIDVNPAFEKVTGLLAADIIGKRVTQVLAETEADQWIKRYGPVAFGGQEMRFEQSSINMDRSLRIHAFSPAAGYFVTMVVDITEETRHKHELAASNELLYRFLNSSSDMAYIKNHEFRYIFVNQALADYYRKQPEEIIGKTDFDLLATPAAKSFRRTDQKALGAGTLIINEEVIGDRIYESIKFPVKLATSNTGIGAFIKDITANRRNEDYLLQQLTRHNILERCITQNFDSLEEQCDYVLREAIHLTGCQFGVIHIYEYSEANAGPELARRLTHFSHNVNMALVTSQLREIWQEIMHSKRAVILNDFGRHHSLQIPARTDEHLVINNILSLPVVFEHRLKAVIALANKDNGFNEFDKNEVSLLLHSLCLIFEYRRNQTLTERERNKLKSIFNELPALICEFLPDSTLTFANQSYCEYFGFYNQSVMGRKFLDLIKLENQAEVSHRYSSLTPQNCKNEYVYKVEVNGQIRLLECRDIGFFNEQGMPLYYYSIGFDVTEKLALEKERDRLLHQFEAMINNHDAVMLVIEPFTGRILDSNPAATEYYGYSKEELLQTNIEEINMLPNEEVKQFRLQALEKGQRYFTFPHRLKSGNIRKVDVYSSPIFYNGNKVLFSIIFDVTERENAYEEIKYINYHDYLTGLYNRRFLEEEFTRLNVRINFPLAIIMGDVNGMKLINDALGNQAGDIVLKDAARLLQSFAREQDIAARVGGDEFAVILPGFEETQVRSLVKRIEARMQENRQQQSPGNLLSISFGYAVQKSPGQSLDALMKEAEGFMFANKYYDERSIKGKTVDIIMKTLFEKSKREKMHSERVGKLAAAIAQEMSLGAEVINRIRIAGYLHDIGKIGINERIINKNTQLDDNEWRMMKSHVERSHRILNNTLEFSEISSIVLYHHEHWDGSGYLEGLKGEAIPLESRIIAVADAFDAMTNPRPYRKTKTRQEALAELQKNAGSQFDPSVVDAFINIIQRVF